MNIKRQQKERRKYLEKAVGYLRVSTDIQLDGYSIPKQDREVRRHCEYANFELLKIYNEDQVLDLL